MRKHLYLFLLVFVITLSFVSADSCVLSSNPYKSGSCVDIVQIGQNVTVVNITTIQYPNSTIAVKPGNMTVNAGYFNYTYCTTTPQGFYVIQGKADVNGIDTPWSCQFEINSNGKKTETSLSLIYMILSIAVFGLFGLGLYFSLIVPFSNSSDATGRIKILKVKYVKLILIAVTYGLFAWLLNIMVELSNSFNGLTTYNGFITMLFNVVISCLWPFFIFMFLFALYNIFKDVKIKKHMSFIMRGGQE